MYHIFLYIIAKLLYMLKALRIPEEAYFRLTCVGNLYEAAPCSQHAFAPQCLLLIPCRTMLHRMESEQTPAHLSPPACLSPGELGVWAASAGTRARICLQFGVPPAHQSHHPNTFH